MHSSIVGGSTAKRVINCPGSVALVAQMPPQPSSSYADEGTLLHTIIANCLTDDLHPDVFLGARHGDVELTHDLIDLKLLPALGALDEISKTMEYAVEQRVDFGKKLPGVFGSADLVGRDGDRAIVLDWKFGSGVIVTAEENEQLMFYAAAARRTLPWAFKGVKEVELVIVQPPDVRRWTTTLARLDRFEAELSAAVAAASLPDAPLKDGEHCRWCAAKPLCPLQTGAVERALHQQLATLPVETISEWLTKADQIEDWVKDLRALAFQLLMEGTDVPGWKLVPKRATRQWSKDERWTAEALQGLGVEDPFEKKLMSPAAVEKLLKKAKIELPSDMVVALSSGDTLAPESDPRPASQQMSRLKAALDKVK